MPRTQAAESTALSHEAPPHDAPPVSPGPSSTGEFAARQRIGRYELLQQIGVGGMGVVFAAYDGVLDRQVAIKLVRSDRADPDSQARIVREGRALARLAHPNVVAVHEVNTHAGQIYMVMEYVRGTTLKQWIAAGRPRSPGEIVEMFLQAGRGLAAAHAQGLVHRDFKPDNVLIGADGRARVVDFGLVSDPGRREAASPEPDAEAGPEERLTRTGALPGTPAYMAPEQLLGLGADARSDQFSFCVALHEALCGERPFAGATAAAIQAAVQAGERRPARRGVPEWLLATIDRGLAAAPERRWPTMTALLEVLARDPVAIHRRRVRLAALLLAVGLGVGLLVLAVTWLQRRWQLERREQDAADQLAAVDARITAARTRGDPDAAARTFDDFVTDPRHRDTAAFAQAWLDEAGRRRGDGDPEAASGALARAFVHAHRPDQAVAALDGLAELFRQQQRWSALSEVLAALTRLDAQAPARRPALVVEAALGLRDLAGARALLPVDAPGSVRDLLDELGGPARPLDLGDLRPVGAEVRDLAGDGGAQLLLWGRAPGGARLDVHALTPALPRLVSHAATADAPRFEHLIPLGPDHDGAQLLLGTRGPQAAAENFVLRPGAGGTLTVRQRWSDSHGLATASGDLDGDGEAELYVGTGPESRHLIELVRGADGGLQPRAPIAAGDEPGSDIHRLLIADVDGDGRRELIMATGPWQAFDLRVYRRDGDGLLRLVARDMLGFVSSAALVRAGGETLIAASHTPSVPSRLMFAPDRPGGAPPGVYFLRLRDDRLERVGFVALPVDPEVNGASLRGGADFNGDGREDLALTYYRHIDTVSTLYLLQEADRSFTPALIGQMALLASFELDGDPAPESLVTLAHADHGDAPWLLGVGDRRIPAVGRPPAADDSPVLMDRIEDPRAWARAAALRSMGLHRDAAEAFAQIARAALDPGAGARALLTAAHEHEQAGDLRRAAAQFAAAEVQPELAEEAARGAHRCHLRLGEYAAASRALGRLLQIPGLSDRDTLARAAAQLRSVASGEAQLVLTFDRPLAPAWTIADPLALRRDPAAGALQVEVAAAAELASFPVEVVSDYLDLELDVTVEAMEWSSTLRLELVAEGEAAAVLGVQAAATGGGRSTSRIYHCGFGPHRVASYQGEPLADSATVERVTLRAATVRGQAEHHCTFGAPDDPEALRVAGAVTSPVAIGSGRHRLILRSATSEGPAQLRAQIHRITLTGARPVADAEDPQRALARALAEGAFAEARQLVAAQPPRTPRQRVWAADLALRSGSLATAHAELAALLRAAASDPALTIDLQTLLRGDRDLYAAALWSAAPREFFALFAGAFATAAHQHIDEPRVQRALLEVLGRAALAELWAPTATSAELALAARLLTWRGLAQLRMHAPGPARRDLLQALELVMRAADDPGGKARRDLRIELAALEAGAGDEAAARGHIAAAIADSGDHRVARDMLRARPELVALVPADER